MEIPQKKNMLVPILSKLNEDGITMYSHDIVDYMAAYCNLTDEAKNRRLVSDNGYVFSGRVQWGLSDMYMAGLLLKPKRAHFKISDLGVSMLKTPDKIPPYVLQKQLERKTVKT